MYLCGLISCDLASKYFSNAQPSLLYTSPFMILGPYFLAKWWKELALLRNEGILNNVLADIFITKLLQKVRNSPRKASSSPVIQERDVTNEAKVPSLKDKFLKVPSS